MGDHKVECSFGWCRCPEKKIVRTQKERGSDEEFVMCQDGDDLLNSVSQSLLQDLVQDNASQSSDDLLAALPLTQMCVSDEMLAALPLTQIYVDETDKLRQAHVTSGLETYELYSQHTQPESDADCLPFVSNGTDLDSKKNECAVGKKTVKKSLFFGLCNRDVPDEPEEDASDDSDDDWFPPNRECVIIPGTPPIMRVSPETGEVVESYSSQMDVAYADSHEQLNCNSCGYTSQMNSCLESIVFPISSGDLEDGEGDGTASHSSIVFSPISCSSSMSDGDLETIQDSARGKLVTALENSPSTSSSDGEVVSAEIIEQNFGISPKRQFVRSSTQWIGCSRIGEGDMMDCSTVAAGFSTADSMCGEDRPPKQSKWNVFQSREAGEEPGPLAVYCEESDDASSTSSDNAIIISATPEDKEASCNDAHRLTTPIPRYVMGVERGPILRLGLRVVIERNAEIDAMAMALLKTCEICSKVYKSRSALRVHQKAVHENVRFSCSVCSNSYSRKSTLKHHLKTHSERVECTRCEKTFIHNSSLIEHFHVQHENRRDLKCEICEKTFYRMAELRQHKQKQHEMNVDESMDET